MPKLPKYEPWPEEAVDLDQSQVIDLYRNGSMGAFKQPEEREALREYLKNSGGYPDGEQALYDYGLVGLGEGKLILPFLAVTKLWPNAWPGPGQTTGDCVSWGTRNSCLVTLAAEILQGHPDEVTGEVEGPPVVSAEGEANGVLATEPIYGDRGHGGQGASCERLARHVTEWGGLMVRQNYADLGIDLTKYNSSIGAKWGGSGTPDAVKGVAKLHQVRTATTLKGAEQTRDMLASMRGVNTCSSLGFSNTRDENGYSKQSGSWAHSQAIIGYDDRDETKQKYGGPLALWLNSWGKWNSGPRLIRDTAINIPEGAYWTDAKHCDRCSLIAFSATNGWPAQKVNWLVSFPD